MPCNRANANVTRCGGEIPICRCQRRQDQIHAREKRGALATCKRPTIHASPGSGAGGEAAPRLSAAKSRWARRRRCGQAGRRSSFARSGPPSGGRRGAAAGPAAASLATVPRTDRPQALPPGTPRRCPYRPPCAHQQIDHGARRPEKLWPKPGTIRNSSVTQKVMIHARPCCTNRIPQPFVVLLFGSNLLPCYRWSAYFSSIFRRPRPRAAHFNIV